jgi:hypothetical protein
MQIHCNAVLGAHLMVCLLLLGNGVVDGQVPQQWSPSIWGLRRIEYGVNGMELFDSFHFRRSEAGRILSTPGTHISDKSACEVKVS